MLSKNKIKFIRSLHRKKARIAEALFIVEGEKMGKELLKNAQFNILEIFTTEKFFLENEQAIKTQTENYNILQAEDLKKISTLSTPNKVLMLVEKPVFSLDWENLRQDLSLYLADIQDPGNLGTILRIADWFGIANVFASPNTVEFFNPKVIQASMGAFLRVKYHVISFGDLKMQLKLPVYGTVLDGDNVYEQALKQQALVVIGNEGNGIPPSICQELDYRIKIPAHENAGAESLNVGIATGIICALFRKS